EDVLACLASARRAVGSERIARVLTPTSSWPAARPMSRLLLDSCVWGGTRAELAAARQDVVWAGDWPDDPGDEELLRRAHAERRILVTLDKDFGQLAVVQGLPHAGIVRLVDIAAERQAQICLQVLAQHEA